MQDTERRQLLKDEYLHIQKTVVELDGRAIIIKAWTVSFSLAALIGAFVAHNAAIFLVSAFSALLFFIIEGFWKHNQQAFYFRSELIERFFAGQLDQLDPFGIDRSMGLPLRATVHAIQRLTRIVPTLARVAVIEGVQA